MNMTRETTKRTITIGSVVFVVLFIITYAYITSHSILSGPSIVLTEINNAPVPLPVKGVIYDSFSTSTVTITGIAKRIQSISLNGFPIVIDENGNFSEVLALFPGLNPETLLGKDAFGHSTSIELDLNRE